MSGERVLVAHDSEPIRAVIEALLVAAGFVVHAVADGGSCMQALEQEPAALVLDVAIGGVLAFQVIDELRRRGADVRVILVASIYNRTSYKRQPTSLYGADDYVEQHHLTDALVPKLTELLAGRAAPRPSASGAAVGESGQVVRQAGEARLGGTGSDGGGEVDAELRAERLARLIVSDIALYNGDALAQIRDRDAMEAHLRLDLEEGRLLFELRVPRAVRERRDFIGEALNELVAARRSVG